jgi:hypothetical protein
VAAQTEMSSMKVKEEMDMARYMDQIMKTMGMMNYKNQRLEKFCAEDPPAYRLRRNGDGTK